MRGPVTTRNVSTALSTSVATSVPASGVSSAVAKARSCATGASFTGVTVSETVATFESSEPSFATYVKPSAPLKSSAGR